MQDAVGQELTEGDHVAIICGIEHNAHYLVPGRILRFGEKSAVVQFTRNGNPEATKAVRPTRMVKYG